MFAMDAFFPHSPRERIIFGVRYALDTATVTSLRPPGLLPGIPECLPSFIASTWKFRHYTTEGWHTAVDVVLGNLVFTLKIVLHENYHNYEAPLFDN